MSHTTLYYVETGVCWHRTPLLHLLKGRKIHSVRFCDKPAMSLPISFQISDSHFLLKDTKKVWAGGARVALQESRRVQDYTSVQQLQRGFLSVQVQRCVTTDSVFDTRRAHFGLFDECLIGLFIKTWDNTNECLYYYTRGASFRLQAHWQVGVDHINNVKLPSVVER